MGPNMWYELKIKIQIPDGATAEQLSGINIPWALFEEFKRVGVECALFESPSLELLPPWPRE